jgi:hypothetical protein
MLRALLFALTGVAFFVFWALTHPSFEMTASMTEWPQVLWFSATFFVLAIALPVFGRMVGGRSIVRLASVAGAGIGLSGVANIFEDGFGIDVAFFGFIAGTMILNVSLIILAVVIARTMPGRSGLWAIVPLGTVTGILLFVVAGGPVMLATWLGAAAAAVSVARREAPIPAIVGGRQAR